MLRPEFKDVKSYAEFKKFYWYKEELQAICRGLGLEYDGEKRELNEIIRQYFDGVIIPHKPRCKVTPTTDALTPETPLVACGFNFGPRFRQFYIEITGDKNFKFNTDMVATAKKVKQSGDESFTLGDLLDVKLGKKVYAVFDKSSCEWNKFLHDFCSDEINDIYPDKLKAASAFWKILRESDLPKIYTREFIEQNKDKVEV